MQSLYKKTSNLGSNQNLPLIAIIMFAMLLFMLLSSAYILINIATSPHTSDLIILVNKIFAFILLLILVNKVTHAIIDKRNNVAGASFNLKMIFSILLIGGLPAILSIFFMQAVIRIGIDDLTKTYVDDADKVSRGLANYYFDTQAQFFGNLLEYELKPAIILAYNNELGRSYINNTKNYDKQKSTYEKFFTDLLISSDLTSIIILDMNGDIITKVQNKIISELPNIPDKDFFLKLMKNKTKNFHFTINNPTTLKSFLAISKFNEFKDIFIIIQKDIPPVITDQLLAIKYLKDRNEKLNSNWENLNKIYTNSYFTIAIVLIYFAIWLALYTTRYIAPTIVYLLQATKSISEGNFDININIKDKNNDLNLLANNFIKMTSKLKQQNKTLIERKNQAKQKQKFIELVLSGISSAIITINEKGDILQANNKACEFFNLPPVKIKNVNLYRDHVLFSKSLKSSLETKNSSFSYNYIKHSSQVIFNVKYTMLSTQKSHNIIITIDDISSLIRAQRNIAWQEVAQKIAHEIKNPLTPIQLSAEWLERNHLPKAGKHKLQFQQAIQNIIDHVDNIKRMVDSFYRFSKLPTPELKKQNIVTIVTKLIEEQKLINNDIVFTTKFACKVIFINCDYRLIMQALLNIIQNSIFALNEQDQVRTKKISLIITLKNKHVNIIITDNGKGFPLSKLNKIADPYVTQRKNGKGLGLAITKKIIIDHGGTIAFANIANNGAKILISLHTVSQQR